METHRSNTRMVCRKDVERKLSVLVGRVDALYRMV